MGANDWQVDGDHYKKTGDPWDALRHVGFLRGTALKYIVRWRLKGGVSDLRKAVHYLQKMDEIGDQPETRGSIAGKALSEYAGRIPESADAAMFHHAAFEDPGAAATFVENMVAKIVEDGVPARGAPERPEEVDVPPTPEPPSYDSPIHDTSAVRFGRVCRNSMEVTNKAEEWRLTLQFTNEAPEQFEIASYEDALVRQLDDRWDPKWSLALRVSEAMSKVDMLSMLAGMVKRTLRAHVLIMNQLMKKKDEAEEDPHAG